MRKVNLEISSKNLFQRPERGISKVCLIWSLHYSFFPQWFSQKRRPNLNFFLPCSTCLTVSPIFFRRILFISWSGTTQFKSLVSGFFAVNPCCSFLDLPPFACLETSCWRILLILMVQKDWRASSSPSNNSVISVRHKSTKQKCQLLYQEKRRITGLLSVRPHIICLKKNKSNVKPKGNDYNNSSAEFK